MVIGLLLRDSAEPLVVLSLELLPTLPHVVEGSLNVSFTHIEYNALLHLCLPTKSYKLKLTPPKI